MDKCEKLAFSPQFSAFMGILLGLGLTGLYLLQTHGIAKLSKYNKVLTRTDSDGRESYKALERGIEEGLVFTIRLVGVAGIVQVVAALLSLALAYTLII